MSSSYQTRVLERDQARKNAQNTLIEKERLQQELREKNAQLVTLQANQAEVNAVKAQLQQAQEDLEKALQAKKAADNAEAEAATALGALTLSGPTTSSSTSPVVWSPPAGYQCCVNLIYYNQSEKLGDGSSGTIVCKGYFDQRPCAVKRLLTACDKEARTELEALLKLDKHPNIIKYYHKEENQDFIFIALELCAGNLMDLPRDTLLHEQKQYILDQIFAALLFLHLKDISHRDIKPANVLFVLEANGSHTIKLADLGFARQVLSSNAQTSVLSRSTGWQSAQVLQYFDAKAQGLDPTPVLPKLADIFSVGILVFWLFCKRPPDHPFGIGTPIETNIMANDAVNMRQKFISCEVEDLVASMIYHEPEGRPRISDCMNHVAMWGQSRGLEFLKITSDWLNSKDAASHPEWTKIEADLGSLSPDWRTIIDSRLLSGKKYSDTLVDLLRCLRNKEHHFDELPANLQASMGNSKEGIFGYFLHFFPSLLLLAFKTMGKYYCRPDPTLLLVGDYLKQPAKLSKAVILIPQLNIYFQDLSSFCTVCECWLDPFRPLFVAVVCSSPLPSHCGVRLLHCFCYRS